MTHELGDQPVPAHAQRRIAAAADRVARRLFDSAALHAWRTNRSRNLDRYRLGRTPILRSDGTFFFRAKVAGLLDTEALAYRALGRGPWRYS